MRIIQITPGSGDNFYCENCLRDNAIVKALRELGHDALLVPLYLPPRLDETGRDNSTPIFFGGINVYLQQKMSIFRKSPRWLDRLWDARGLLNQAAKKVGMTSAQDLGETTISMLRGEEGRQVKELNRLVDWLEKEARPDIVCLSNSLLVGMARRIKERLEVPVVCLLQDEDEFLDALEEEHREPAWRILAERARDVDLFISVSNYYEQVMKQRLGLSNERITTVYQGISLEGFKPATAAPQVPTIGYLSRLCPTKGLDWLAEAFLILKQNDKLKHTRLRIAGGKTKADDDFIKGVHERLKRGGVLEDVEFLDSFERPARQNFLRSLTVLSVPERRGAAWGLYVLEALACGVPVVQPRNGVFIELLEMTGGGLLVSELDEAQEIADALEKLLLDTNYARELGHKGRQVIIDRFDVKKSACQLLQAYEKVKQVYTR